MNKTDEYFNKPNITTDDCQQIIETIVKNKDVRSIQHFQEYLILEELEQLIFHTPTIEDAMERLWKIRGMIQMSNAKIRDKAIMLNDKLEKG